MNTFSGISFSFGLVDEMVAKSKPCAQLRRLCLKQHSKRMLTSEMPYETSTCLVSSEISHADDVNDALSTCV